MQEICENAFYDVYKHTKLMKEGIMIKITWLSLASAAEPLILSFNVSVCQV